MTFDEVLARLKEAQGDPDKLTIATARIVAGDDPRLWEALEAAAIPHWFDARILGAILETSPEEAANLFERLTRLSMVESFPAKVGYNVHEATRMALRKSLLAERPDDLARWSRRAAACWPGDDVASRVEAAYHDKSAAEAELAGDRDEEGLRRGLAVACHHLGHAYLAQGRRGSALAEFESDQRIMADLCARDPGNADWQRELSVSHNNVGGVYQSQGKLAEALAEFESDKRIMADLCARDPRNPDWQRDLSVSHNWVGRVYQSQGKLSEALAEFESDQRIMADLCARDPGNAAWLRELSVSHNNVGRVYQSQGKLAEALAEYESGKRIRADLCARDPGNADWQSELSVSHNNVGRVYQSQGKLPEALAEFESYQRIMADLCARDPGNAAWQRELSVSHNCVGGVYQSQGKLLEALAEFESDKRIMADLCARDPGNADWQQDLAVTHNRLAAVHLDLHRATAGAAHLDTATRESTAALRILEALLATGGQPDWRRRLAQTRTGLADLYLQQGRAEAALAEAREAVAILERLLELDASNADWNEDLDAARRMERKAQQALADL